MAGRIPAERTSPSRPERLAPAVAGARRPRGAHTSYGTSAVSGVAEVQQLPADHWREVGMDR
ncbi:hypothetical protein GCM10010330_48200 [Streptomyces tendae]|nr:hypothetical protein GCM10010330_48200 [Streptomyces tendae]